MSCAFEQFYGILRTINVNYYLLLLLLLLMYLVILYSATELLFYLSYIFVSVTCCFCFEALSSKFSVQHFRVK